MTTDMHEWEEKWQTKCWGHVRHVFESDEVAVSVLKVKKGFRCSLHLHQFRRNQFDVISGKITVCEWADENDLQMNPDRPIEQTILTGGMSIRIGAGRPHMFRVLEDGIVVEIYTPDKGPVDVDDIVRFDEGGRDDPS
jgi:mannose-6-phosphate isomerase-like protein (cupin superfamily)